jgi:hypothetical protein
MWWYCTSIERLISLSDLGSLNIADLIDFAVVSPFLQ